MQLRENKPKLKQYLINTLIRHKEYHLERNYISLIAFIYLLAVTLIISYFGVTFKLMELNFPMLIELLLLLLFIIISVIIGCIIIFSINWLLSTFITKELLDS